MDLERLGKMLDQIAWTFGDRGKVQDCCHGLSQVELRVLEMTCARRNHSIQEIAKNLGFTKSGGTRVIDRLVSRGLLKRCHSAEDGRICCVVPTEEGLSLLGRIRKERTADLERVISRMDPVLVDGLETSLEAFTRALGTD